MEVADIRTQVGMQVGNGAPTFKDIHDQALRLRGLAVSLSVIDYHEISPDMDGTNRETLDGVTTLIDEIKDKSQAMCAALEQLRHDLDGELL